MADSYRWRLSGNRGALLEDLVDVTDEQTKAKALEAAVVGFLRLAGQNGVEPGQGALEELLATADERGSLTAAEIAEILATDELPVKYEPATWTIGVVDD